MKNIIFLCAFLLCLASFSQNIKCEIIDYAKTLDSIEYSSYQYINASYSYSRPLILLITNQEKFSIIYSQIPKLFIKKQEYTDIWMLGIRNLNESNMSSASCSKIIDYFVNSILKYRSDHNLPKYDKSQILCNMIYLEKSSDLCIYLNCKN